MTIDLMAHPPLYVDLEPHSDKLRIKTVFAHKDDMAVIPGATFKGAGKDYWLLPRRWAQVKLLTNIFGSAIQWSDAALAWVNEYYNTIVGPATALRNDIIDPDLLEAVRSLCKARNLFDYQVTGSMYLATAKRAMLWDETGTGKMIQGAFALSAYPDTLPALIVCPNSVLYTWQAELKLFGIESVVVSGQDSADKRRQAFQAFDPDETPVMIISYSLLAKHTRVSGYGNIKLSEADKTKKELNSIPWQCVLADECHRIKEPDSVQTRALWGVSQNAEYRWGTTATPVEKDFMDTWSLLHYLDPEEWPSSVKARDRWALQQPNFFGGMDIKGLRPDTQDEYYSVLDWHWRRQLTDKEKMPPTVTERRYCHLVGPQAKAYKDMAKQLMAEVGEGDTSKVLFAPNHMVKTTRLLQMASSAIEIDDADEVTPVEPSAKLALMMDTLEDTPQPCILWFKHRKLLHLAEDRLNKAGITHVSIHGGITPKQRFEHVRMFQEGEVDRILIVMAAGSEGVTLTRAPVAIYVERDWSLILNTQAPGRNLRIGSEIHDEIRTINLITKGTVEEDLYDSLTEKADNAEEVLRDRAKAA